MTTPPHQPDSTWWNQDVSDAGQGLYFQPQLAMDVATVPASLLAAQELQRRARAAEEASARETRGGFLKSVMGAVRDVGDSLDGALSHVPGWGVAKDGMEALWYPVDRAAAGAYWLYSEAISQPLSTLVLQVAKADLNGYGTLLSADEWQDAYGQAENISPGQAIANAANVMSVTGEAGITAPVPSIGDAPSLTPEERDQVRRNAERFLYDSDFWRDKQGWKYTVGTGTMDFITQIALDPASAAIAGTATAVRAGRSIYSVTDAAVDADRLLLPAERAGQAVGRALAPAPRTPVEAVQARSVNEFFDWAEGRSAAEIAQHPIWGSGRRVNPAKEQTSQVLANTRREDMPLILRFAIGDNEAASTLVTRSQDTVIQLAKAQESRVLVDSMRYDTEILAHFVDEEVAGRTAANLPFEGVGGQSSPYTATGQLVEPPYPRPQEPGPRQTGWDLAYGDLGKAAEIYRDTARYIADNLHGVQGLGPAARTASADLLRAQEWRAAQLDTMDLQISELAKREDYYGRILGSLPKGLEDFVPGESNIFGTSKRMYRMGPLAVVSPEATANRRIARLGSGRGDKVTDGGFATRLIRNGFYTPAIRMVQSFGERMPESFIDHNAEDSYMRVAEMLKQVPGLGQETRIDMINRYVAAGDKVQRSRVLNDIHASVIEHMATRVAGLDPQTAAVINEMREVGFSKVMRDLTGRVPSDQRFSAAKDPLTGRYVDFTEDGEAYVIHPLTKTQLATGEPLLNVREFERTLRRNSGMLRTLRRAGGSARDNVTSVMDSLNTVWKAGTLLRPGYVLRSMSEEQVASAVKFGMISSIMGASQGGMNWARNRKQQFLAVLGQGSYASPSGGGARIRIEDPNALQAASRHNLKTERIKISSAWPLVYDRISRERDAIKKLEAKLKSLTEGGAGGNQSAIDDIHISLIDHRNVLEEHMDYARALLSEAETSRGARLGEAEFEFGGISIPQAFSKQWENPIPRDQITSARAMETIFARGEAIDNARIIKTGSWTVVTPEDPNYMESWLRGINQQFRQDQLFRLVAEDPSLRKAKSWLRTSEGKYHLSLLGPRARNADGTLRAIKLTLDQYLPPGTGLQAKIAKNEEVTEAELRAALAEGDFPPVHGEELKSLTAAHSTESASRLVDDLIERGFNALSTIPNDIMARQPIYLRAQEARMKELLAQEVSYRSSIGEAPRFDLGTLNKMLEKSDRLARKDISQVVYDPVRTTATDALRFVTPFLSAHVDGIQRWGGLLAERPQFATTAAKIYNAPVAANLVTDRYGRPVGQDGYVDIRDEEGRITGREFVPLQERILTLRVPGGTRNIKGVGEVPAGGIPISLSAINTILPGDPWFNPGSGPYVQMVASQIAKNSPSAGDFLQWAKVLPYGPDEDWYDSLFPKYMQDAWDAFTAGDAGNEAYQRAYLSEYQRQQAEYANGGDPPDMDEVAKNARRFMFLEAFTAWASPVQTRGTALTGTPYQFFVDQFKALQEADPATARDTFMARYGADYYAFTASLSESMGIAATVSADETAELYGDLIERDPDMAPLIIGDVYNQGQFSPSVYRKQMEQVIAGQRVRQPLTAEEAIRRNRVDLGWSVYNRLMHTMDAALIRSGFTSYSQKGAEGFAITKRTLTDVLAATNEEWYEDFGETQLNKVPLTINSLTRIAADPRLQADPFRSDIRTLGVYLQERSALQALLRARGARSLSFDMNGNPIGENADIGLQFRTMQTMLINADTRFGDLFHRYLERDDLS